MAKFRHIIKNRNFVFLLLGQIISQFGDRLNQMALIALIFKMAPGSTFQLAKLMSITILPVFIIGPIAGVYVDRWDRRRTMFTCDFIRVLLICLIPAFFMKDHSFMFLYIIVFLVFCLSRFFVLSKMSILPDMVQKEDLLLANSLLNTTGMVAAALGFGVGGILIEIIGPKGGFYLDACTFFISGSLIFFMSTKSGGKVKPADVLKVGKEIVEVIQQSMLEEVKSVWEFLRKQSNIRYVLTILFILWASLGSIYVVLIVFIQRVFSSVVKDLGLLAVFLGVGLFCGSLLYGRLGKKVSYFRAIFVSLTLAGIAFIVFTVTSYNIMDFKLAAFFVFILGVVVAPIMIASNTIIHELTEPTMRGKIFTVLEIVVHTAFIIFMFITSFLAEILAKRFAVLGNEAILLGQFVVLLSVGGGILLVGILGTLKKHVKITRI